MCNTKQSATEGSPSHSDRPIHASGIVLQQYEEVPDTDGICIPSWRLSSSSLVYSPTLTTGTASQVDGELYVRGTRAYAFRAVTATVTETPQPNSVLQVAGDLEVTDGVSGVTLQCQILTWEAASQVLRLGGSVTARLHSDMIVTTPELSISLSGSQSLEERFAYCNGYSSNSQGDNGPRNLTVLKGPCHAHAKLPASVFGGLHVNLNFPAAFRSCFERWLGKNLFCERGHFVSVLKQLFGHDTYWTEKTATSLVPWEVNAAVIPTDLQSTAESDTSSIEVIISAEKGVILDMENGLFSSPGNLSIKCPAQGAQVSAGAGDLLFRDGILVALHGGVAAQIQRSSLQAHKVSWYLCDEDPEGSNWLTDISWWLQKPQVGKNIPRTSVGQAFGRRLLDVGLPHDDSNMENASVVERFRAKVTRLRQLSPGLASPLKIPRMTRIASCPLKWASRDTSRIVLRKGKTFGNLTRIFQAFCKQVVSTLHMSFTTSDISDFVGVEFKVSEWLDSSQSRGVGVKDRLNCVSSVKDELYALCEHGKGSVVVAEGGVRVWWH